MPGAIRRLVDELRRRGIVVHEWPGWDGRGNSDGGSGPRITQIEPVGAVIHHTGSPYGSGYTGLVSSTRPELRGGCVCNFSGNDDGSVTVIASGLAWHAGPGVGPSLGPVLSRIPNIRNRMNRLTVGLEIVYPGDQPMRPAQYRTGCVFAAAVADLFGGGDLECVRAHAETNGNAPGGSGKWDPGCAPGRTIDMAAFRRDAAATRQEDDLMSALDEPITKPDGSTTTLRQVIAWSDANIDGTRALIREQTAAVVDALLDTEIDREDLGLRPTTLRQILRWSDPNTDRLLTSVAAATAAASGADPQKVAEQVRAAVAGELSGLRITVAPAD